MRHNFFIHSSVHRHFGCFYDLAIVNSAAMNIGVFASFQTMFLSGCPVVVLQDHMVTEFLVF